MHAIERDGDHLAGPGRIEAAVWVLDRLRVRIDKHRPGEVLLGRVDGRRCALFTALLSQLVEGSPELVEVLCEWVGGHLVRGTAAFALTLAESRLLDGDRLRYAG